MFAFISKLLPRRSNAQAAPVTEALLAKQIAVQQDRQKDEEQLRHAYLQKIAAAANNESASIELLLACDFADGRFQAAQAVQSAAGLEKLRLAMRNADKRVVKLVQTRLDEIHRTEQGLAAAKAWFTQAESLLAQEIVLSNQVSDLEKLGAQITAFPVAQRGLFEEKCQELEQKLARQASLQRELLDLVQRIDAVVDHADVQLSSKIEEWESILSTALSQSYAAALPKNLTVEVKQKLSALRQNWQSAQQRSQNREDSAQHQASRNFAPVIEGENEFVGDSPIVDAELAPKLVAKPRNSKPSLSLSEIETALSGFESALEEGSIQSARKFDRELRDVDVRNNTQASALSVASRECLSAARKELGNMLSWAKWSGNVSRDELVATAEGLATLTLSPKELVGTVSALRDQWKQMETGGSSINKALWERFDAACSAAYAPAAQHFQEQAALRKKNLQQADSVLRGFQEQAQALLAAEPDWKAINQALSRMRQEWRELGHLDRKDKLRLDEELAQILNSLRTPLAQQQAAEISARTKLIADAHAIDAAKKNAVDQLRSLQEQWKSRAGNVPLARKDEQELWEKFRAACDAVFDQRKQVMASADLQRQDNLQAKQALCARLENCTLSSKAELLKELQACALLVKSLGQIPRDHETALEQRYQSAVAALQLVVDGHTAQESRAGRVRLLESVALCQRAEQLLLANALSSETAPERELERAALLDSWNANQAVGKSKPSAIERSVKTRFDLTLQALTANSEARHLHQTAMQKNLPVFDDLILHLEILTAAESPNSLSQARLKKQVEVLQNSLKNGNDDATTQTVAAQLLGLPVSLDAARQQRLENIIGYIA